MLTKKQFIKRLKFLQSFKERMDTFSEALCKYAPSDFTGFFDEETFNFLLSTLEEDMNDKYQNITWWICETDWGKRKDLCGIWEEDAGEEPTWKINTMEDLYAYLFCQNSKTPTKESLQLALRCQDNGVKFCLKEIQNVIDRNYETQNFGWEERNALLNYIKTIIKNNYLLKRGISVDLDYDKSIEIMSILEEEEKDDKNHE